MQQYLSRAELAETLGMHTETIRRLTRAQKIPFYRVGRAYRYELEAVLEAFKHDPLPDASQAQKTALLG